ncbi:FG-GAP-like repeat-containing protein [Neorhodopirellula pilleata]|uniref:ASPIC and UnbV n=1 Tax=Neorhodopirellula pilleata TaxID=2714738 RepID=A0A5C6AQZ5_9BACT|nr:FG-GAP-like repeat-containing protein [Neorhodopirellula pilleata]TWU01891.1 ASPIC and UnbV [Neorhodopirellula pilleata]
MTSILSPLHRLNLVLSLLLVLLLVLSGGCGGTNAPVTTPTDEVIAETARTPPLSDDRHERFHRVVALVDEGRFAEVEVVLRPLLLKNPDDYEAVFHLANASAAMGDLERAIALLAEIPPEHPEAGLPSLGVSAGWCFELARYDEAESRYLKILELDPSVSLARRQLAYLYNRQGRRHEAVRFIRELCQRGDVMQEELHALIVESDAMYDPPGMLPPGNGRPYWPIGELSRARKLFTDGRYLEAADMVEPFVASGQASHGMIAFHGRALVEAQVDERLNLWLAHCSEELKAYPDYWAAIGTYLLRETKYDAALQAIAEAIRLDPTDMHSVRRMFQCLRSIGQPDRADVWIERYALMTRILRSSNAIASADAPSDESFEQLAKELDSADRHLEALLWRSMSASHARDQERLAELQMSMRRLVVENDDFPTRKEIWCGMDFGHTELSSLPLIVTGRLTQRGLDKTNVDVPVTPATFRDVSSDVGLAHSFMIATDPPRKAFAIYQTFGGGVAVLDYDLDGEPDFYLAQGAADPKGFVAVKSDQLYRHQRDQSKRKLSDVTSPARTTEASYSLGVTAGDWNQDGFADLAVANLGTNVLLINQGDGTFLKVPLDETPDLTRVSTSLAMGDVTGDDLPDLFALSYARDSKITKRPELDREGNPQDAIAPLSLQAGRDQIYINHDDGHWQTKWVGDSQEQACTGLGLVLTDILPDLPGNEIFVANDVRNNQLWVRGDQDQLIDQAIPFGCAFGSVGSATAAMGIAVGDFDHSGTLDLHVTNFADQPVSLYMGGTRFFRDLNVQFNLADDSKPVVGFGTQAIDYSNDGWPDLAVANGHVEDLRHRGQEFEQPFQLFANRAGRFEQTPIENCDYTQEPHLGRALATLDFNRDGKNDLIVTDMLGPTALLLNESTTSHHWIAFRLVGTTCERDAIGARIIVETEQQEWIGSVASGDGFLCKNESLVHFGIGENRSLAKVSIQWPDGSSQDLEPMTVDGAYLVVQDQERPFELKR